MLSFVHSYINLFITYSLRMTIDNMAIGLVENIKINRNTILFVSAPMPVSPGAQQLVGRIIHYA